MSAALYTKLKCLSHTIEHDARKLQKPLDRANVKEIDEIVADIDRIKQLLETAKSLQNSSTEIIKALDAHLRTKKSVDKCNSNYLLPDISKPSTSKALQVHFSNKENIKITSMQKNVHANDAVVMNNGQLSKSPFSSFLAKALNIDSEKVSPIYANVGSPLVKFNKETSTPIASRVQDPPKSPRLSPDLNSIYTDLNSILNVLRSPKTSNQASPSVNTSPRVSCTKNDTQESPVGKYYVIYFN